MFIFNLNRIDLLSLNKRNSFEILLLILKTLNIFRPRF